VPIPAFPRPTLSWLPPLFLTAASILYYAVYFQAGYNYTDEGNYVQFAYELARGSSLNDLPVSYGFLWFKLGELVFRLFGPDLLLARAIFFVCALATTLLVYAALVIFTGRRWFAAIIALVPAVAPAFLPTSFYGLCILINCVPQLRLAARLDRATPMDAALAGAALALSFQIRPDFGYIFAAPLVILLMLAAYEKGPGLKLASAALAAFGIAHVPGLILALNDGYLSTLLGQYLSYPVMLVDYGVRGVSALLNGSNVGVPAAGTLLQRPHLLSGDFAEVRLALLVYLPVLVIVGFVITNAALSWRTVGRLSHGGATLVILVTGAAALPHYFFYRPDLSHIANFMPGFVVLAGAFAWQGMTLNTPRVVRFIPLAVALTLMLYLSAALTTEGTGSIAGASARTEWFTSGNGVNVRLQPGEKALLEDLKRVIETHSGPDDPIVCVPYCPGIAFMTGRRLLFREQYVDDSVPLRDPEWISRAIALTQEKRPRVVIVMDWAINGTEISRFSRWASPYMEALESLAREKLERPGLSIYLL
jgi:hypothetical protein